MPTKTLFPFHIGFVTGVVGRIKIGKAGGVKHGDLVVWWLITVKFSAVFRKAQQTSSGVLHCDSFR